MQFEKLKRWIMDSLGEFEYQLEKDSIEKTPDKILDELCRENDVEATYNLIEVSTSFDLPTFIYEVQVGYEKTIGTGQTQQLAKEDAAQKILEILQTKNQCTLYENRLENISVTIINGNKRPCPYDSAGNPVGRLQELCVAQEWALPKYRNTYDDLTNVQLFTINCIVNNISVQGEGVSKRLAKQDAAFKMLKRLKAVLRERPIIIDRALVRARSDVTCALLNESQHEVFNRPVNEDTNAIKALPSINIESGNAVNYCYKLMKEKPSDSLKVLHCVSALPKGLAGVVFLQNIAKEYNFNVKYIDSSEQSTSDGLYKCLVELSLNPVTVIQGRGTSVQTARYDAIENVLFYLKVATK
ncbi:hypothetical protein CHUAL_002108 [Chamberlinius hualienensis]